MIEIATLCREGSVNGWGLLSLTDAGLQRKFSPEYPHALDCKLALRLARDSVSASEQTQINIGVVDEDGAAIGVLLINVPPLEENRRPIVAGTGIPSAYGHVVSLSGIDVPRPGLYNVHIRVKGRLRRTLTFYAVKHSKNKSGWL